MRKFIALVFLVGVVFGLRRHRYPFESLALASGEQYEIRSVPRQCFGGADRCLTSYLYLTASMDSLAQAREIAPLAVHLQREAVKRGDVGVALTAVAPRAFRLLPPVDARVYAYVRQADGTWKLMKRVPVKFEGTGTITIRE